MTEAKKQEIRFQELEKVVKKLETEIENYKSKPQFWSYSVKEVAVQLGVSSRTIQRLIHKGVIKNVLRLEMEHSFRGFIYRIPLKEVKGLMNYLAKNDLFYLERLTSPRSLRYNAKSRKIEDIGFASPEVMEKRKSFQKSIEKRKKEKQERLEELERIKQKWEPGNPMILDETEPEPQESLEIYSTALEGEEIEIKYPEGFFEKRPDSKLHSE